MVNCKNDHFHFFLGLKSCYLHFSNNLYKKVIKETTFFANFFNNSINNYYFLFLDLTAPASDTTANDNTPNAPASPVFGDFSETLLVV